MAKISLFKQSNLIKKLVIFHLLVTMIGGVFVTPVLAVEPLIITNINVTFTDMTATITWRTNQPATGKVEYGLYSNDYHWILNTNRKVDEQAITISGLFPETTYFLRITAKNDTSEVVSFEQNFKTKKLSDNKAPLLSDVQVIYTTGATATIQWLTDEPATTEVDYGRTTSYGSNKSDSRKVQVHDITLTGLIDGTYYHFLAKSKDADNNISRWYDMTFYTKVTNVSDREELIIFNVKPASENDTNVTQSSAVISWRTNKVAEGFVRYGTSNTYGKTIVANPPRDFSKSVTLINLNPGTTYYFEIEAKDVTGKVTKSNGHSFTTKRPEPAADSQPDYGSNPQTLGTYTCDINLKTDLGYFGLYYNLPEGHPDMQLKPQGWSKVGRQNDWYNPEYFSRSQIDSRIDFFNQFLPLNEGKPGDPFHFAVNWRAIINVPEDNFYSYEIRSDDDSWVFIDDQLVTNLGGIHGAKDERKEVSLTKGYHKLEIYYADRSRSNASIVFKPDLRLKFHPLPEGCEVEDVLDYNQWLASGGQRATGGQPPANGNGQVLGDYYEEPASAPQYVCNSNLGYTKFKALYKTPESPDVWAILETGQKHYITSPESFNLYQCNWRDIKTVSKSFLNQFANANLVRTPADPMIYYLFQRPEKKWLKRNIPSPTVFISYPDNYWGNVARVNYLDIQAYPDAQLIKTLDKPEVYLIEGTFKRHIRDVEVFERFGYDWAEVVELSQIHLDSFENGAVID